MQISSRHRRTESHENQHSGVLGYGKFISEVFLVPGFSVVNRIGYLQNFSNFLFIPGFSGTENPDQMHREGRCKANFPKSLPNFMNVIIREFLSKGSSFLVAFQITDSQIEGAAMQILRINFKISILNTLKFLFEFPYDIVLLKIRVITKTLSDCEAILYHFH